MLQFTRFAQLRCSSFAVTILLLTSLGGLGSSAFAQNPKSNLAKQVGVKNGLCVFLGDHPATTIIDLAKHSELTIYVQTESPANANRLRQQLDAAGLLGTRVYAESGNPKYIHLANNLADAVFITSDDSAAKKYTEQEVFRVLHPGGKLISGSRVTAAPADKGAGEWSHPYHSPDNNPLGEDKLAKAPFLTRF